MAKKERTLEQKAKRNKNIYKLITILTLVLPMPVYLMVSACILSIEPDYVLREADTREWVVVEDDGNYAFEIDTTVNDEFWVSGDEVMVGSGYMAIPFVPNETIFQVQSGILDSGFYLVSLDETDFTIATWENHTDSLMSKQLSYKIPIGVIFSILAVVIICLIIFKKMNLLKKRPRLSVMLSLGTATILLLILEMIISSMLGMFITASVMWATYCLEYIIYNRKTLFNEKDKQESETLKQLTEMLEKYKK